MITNKKAKFKGYTYDYDHRNRTGATYEYRGEYYTLCFPGYDISYMSSMTQKHKEAQEKIDKMIEKRKKTVERVPGTNETWEAFELFWSEIYNDDDK